MKSVTNYSFWGSSINILYICASLQFNASNLSPTLEEKCRQCSLVFCQGGSGRRQTFLFRLVKMLQISFIDLITLVMVSSFSPLASKARHLYAVCHIISRNKLWEHCVWGLESTFCVVSQYCDLKDGISICESGQNCLILSVRFAFVKDASNCAFYH